MNNKKLVVIGGDAAAGMTAASKVRREQPEREIVVFERGNHTSYAACGMPYYIGGQIVGFKGAAKRIDTIVTAITAGLTIQQLMDLDLAYAPPFSTAWDPVQIAARRLR